jgi:hypothetical protein
MKNLVQKPCDPEPVVDPVNCVIDGAEVTGDPCPADGEGLCYETVDGDAVPIVRVETDCEPAPLVTCVVDGDPLTGTDCPAGGDGKCFMGGDEVDCEPANTVNCVIDGVDTIGDPCPADGEG